MAYNSTKKSFLASMIASLFVIILSLRFLFFILCIPFWDSLLCAWQTVSDFGKTHFIIGYTHTTDQQSVKKNDENQSQESDGSAKELIKQNGEIRQVFFSPDDKVRAVLLDLINNEQEAIEIAIFAFTDSKIAQALIDALKRKVRVEVIADPGCLKDPYSKISFLCDAGIAIYVYSSQNSNRRFSSIMHHKFALFKKNIEGRSILWTGSFNFTRAAHKANQENVLVLDDQKIIDRFGKQFQRVKTRSYRYKRA